MTRVLVGEHSPTFALSLRKLLGAGPELEVVEVCATAEATVDGATRLAPDLVIMDLDLQGSLDAVRRLMRLHPVAIVAFGADVARGSAAAAVALAAGCTEVIPQSQLRVEEPDGAAAIALRHRLRRLARSNSEARANGRPAESPPVPREQSLARAAVVGICASTGGPAALAAILEDLPPDFPLPLLVVQHIAEGFLDGLVQWLDERVLLPVSIARDGMPLRRGVWFAPEDAHLVLSPSMCLALDRETVIGAHRPSADMLLTSMADVAGRGALAVVLTGMGRDGAEGVAAITEAGGSVIAQDEASSIVYGMPKVAAQQGAALVLGLDQIAPTLSQLSLTRTPS